MTLSYTDSDYQREEARSAAALQSLQAELARAVENAKSGIPVSPGIIPNLRDEIELATLALDGARERAQAERDRLPTPEQARAAIKALADAEQSSLRNVTEAIRAFTSAQDELLRVVTGHNQLLTAKVSDITRTGIPTKGATLDGDRINIHGASLFRHGSTVIDYVHMMPAALDPTLKKLVGEDADRAV